MKLIQKIIKIFYPIIKLDVIKIISTSFCLYRIFNHKISNNNLENDVETNIIEWY